MERRHIHANGAIIIGKEVNTIEEEQLGLDPTQVFLDKKVIFEKILALEPRDAEKLGVGRRTLNYLKERIQRNGDINMRTGAVRKLLGFQ